MTDSAFENPENRTPLVQHRVVQATGDRLVRLEFTKPPHPGTFIRSEIIEGLGLSVSEAAKALGVIRPTLSAMLNARASLSPEMALRIEKAFGVSMDTLMQMQCSYDIAQPRLREGEIDVPPFVSKTKPGQQESLL